MRALLLAGLVLLAGCAAAPPPARDATVEPAADPPGPRESAPEPTPPPPATAPAESSAPALARTPLAVEGRTARGACEHLECVDAEPADGAWIELDALGAPGRPHAIAGTLTWTAETPATEQMSVYVYAKRSGAWTHEFGRDPLAGGASPLALNLSLAALADSTVALHVTAARGCWCGPFRLAADPGQDFRLDGEYVTRLAAIGGAPSRGNETASG